LRFPPPQFDWVPLNVWLPANWWPHLVRHVVDREEVAYRGAQAGAALRLGVATDDGELGDATAGLAECDVPDVEGARADEQADHLARARERRAGAARRLASRVAGRAAAGTVRAGHLGVGVQVEQVVVRDQLEADRGLVLVDLAHPVDQRDLGRRHVRGAAEVGRVAGIGQEGRR
jgi:hypothetical protein